MKASARRISEISEVDRTALNRLSDQLRQDHAWTLIAIPDGWIVRVYVAGIGEPVVSGHGRTIAEAVNEVLA